MTRRRLTGVIAALALTAAACGGDASPDEIILLTHDSFAISADVLAGFEAQTGVAVRVLKGGDAGIMVAGAILTKDNPTADVMYGIDNTFLSKALEEDLFLPHTSAELDSVPPDLVLDPANRVTPIDVANVCINYDKAGLAAAGLSPPTTLRDLTDEAYRGTLVVTDPATSSPGLAFLLSTISEFPETSAYAWQAFWEDLAANDVLVASDWEQAYFSEFSGGSETGTRPIVVSYASSPPVGVIFSEEVLTDAPTGALLDGCFRQIEFAGILSGTEQPELAGQLIDYMLSVAFQEDIPLNMFVFPANSDAELPDVFVDFTSYPTDANIVPIGEIEANRDKWIEEWSAILQ